MTDTYNDTTGSRKKFLIPLVVLLLCAVSLTGAGYAYNATMTVPDSHIDGGDLTIDLATGSSSDISFTGVDNCITVTDNLVYASGLASKTNTIKAFAQDGVITYAIKITGESPSATLKIKSTDIAAYLATAIGDTTIGNLVSFKVGIENEVTKAKTLSGTDVVFSEPKAAGETVNPTVYVFVVPVTNSEVTVKASDTYNAERAAAYYAGLIDNAKFTITFTADSEALPASEHGHNLVLAATWADDGSTCTVNASCDQCGLDEDVNVTAAIQHYTKTAPTCEEAGVEYYWVSGTYDGVEYYFFKNVAIAPLATP